MKWIGLLTFGLIGLGLMLFSTGWGIKQYFYLSRSLRTQGKVVTNTRSDPTEPEAGDVEIEFRTKDGQTVRFRPSLGRTRSIKLDVGKSVEVLYDRRHPNDAQLAALVQSWTDALGAGAGGLVFLLAGIFAFIMVNKIDRELDAVREMHGPFERALLFEQKEGVRVQGTVSEIKSQKGAYVVICRAKMAGRKAARLFESDPLQFNPGDSILGKLVDIYVHPTDSGRYYVHLDPLLSKMVEVPVPPK